MQPQVYISIAFKKSADIKIEEVQRVAMSVRYEQRTIDQKSLIEELPTRDTWWFFIGNIMTQKCVSREYKNADAILHNTHFIFTSHCRLQD
jgi:hypothetical protein